VTYFLGYLLFGFALHFVGSQIMRIPLNEDWRWELAACVFWPLTVLLAIITVAKKRTMGTGSKT
jgi:hypothetical protein